MISAGLRRTLAAALLALLGIACAVGAISAARELDGAAVELRWDEPIDAQAFKSALEWIEYPISAVLWMQNANVNCQGMHSQELDAAIFYGDSRLLTGGTAAIAQFGLSSTVAYELFGTENARELPVSLDDNQYAVDEIFHSSVADALVRWNGVAETEFTNLSLAFPGQAMGMWRQRALEFATAMGLPEPDCILDAPILAELAHMLAGLPALALLAWLIIVQLKAIGKPPGIKRRLVRLSALVATAVMAILILNWNVEPPRWLLPTRWSDFSFWQSRFSEIMGRLDSFISAEKFAIEGNWLYAMLRSAALSIASTHLLLIFCGRMKRTAANIEKSSDNRSE